MSDKTTDEMRVYLGPFLVLQGLEGNLLNAQAAKVYDAAVEALAAQAHPTDEEEVERVARAVTDALWPVLGGNHTAAELWGEIGEAVRSAALNAIRGK